MSEQQKELSAIVRNTLNQHGYAFAQAVVQVFKTQYEKGESKWRFEALEFPIEVKGNSSRIDILLKSNNDEKYLVVECKRVNPALKNWSFFKFPFLRFNRTDDPFIAQKLTLGSATQERLGHYEMEGEVVRYDTNELTYHLGLETKTNEKGDPQGGRGDEIEKALTQVCRGVNGLVEILTAKRSFSDTRRHITIIPLIVTTANLFTSNNLIYETNMDNGNYEKDIVLNKTDWLYYQYPQTPGIIHQYAKNQNLCNDLSYLYDKEYLRTVCIVNATKLDLFLNSFNPESIR